MKRILFVSAVVAALAAGAFVATLATAAPTEPPAPAVQILPEVVEVPAGTTGTMTGSEGCTVSYSVAGSMVTVTKVTCGLGGTLDEQARAALGVYYDEMMAAAIASQ